MASVLRAPIPFMTSHLPKSPSTDMSPLGVKITTYEFGRDTNVQTLDLLKSQPFFKCCVHVKI